MLFVVSETKSKSPGHFRIEWRIPAIVGDCNEGEGLTRYLYWAYEQNAMYGLHSPFNRTGARSRTASFLHPTVTADLELRVISGGAGEYKDGLHWCEKAGVLYRKLSGTHYLTHHGLDGFPEKAYNCLYREIGSKNPPRFEIRPAEGGKFYLSMDEWLAHLTSGKNYDRLSQLGLTLKREVK